MLSTFHKTVHHVTTLLILEPKNDILHIYNRFYFCQTFFKELENFTLQRFKFGTFQRMITLNSWRSYKKKNIIQCIDLGNS